MITPCGPPYSGYPAGPPPAVGRLVVDTSYHPMSFVLGLTGRGMGLMISLNIVPIVLLFVYLVVALSVFF